MSLNFSYFEEYQKKAMGSESHLTLKEHFSNLNYNFITHLVHSIK